MLVEDQNASKTHSRLLVASFDPWEPSARSSLVDLDVRAPESRETEMEANRLPKHLFLVPNAGYLQTATVRRLTGRGLGVDVAVLSARMADEGRDGTWRTLVQKLELLLREGDGVSRLCLLVLGGVQVLPGDCVDCRYHVGHSLALRGS